MNKGRRREKKEGINRGSKGSGGREEEELRREA